MLIRNVAYEGPALRRQLAKAQQLQQELSRREVECQSSAADMRERYSAACRQYGIRVGTGSPLTGLMIPPQPVSLPLYIRLFFYDHRGTM